MFCFLFCAVYFCIVLCIVSPNIYIYIYIDLYFLFVYNFTDNCHRVETQLQFISNHINSIISLFIAHPYDRVLPITEDVKAGI